MQIRLYTASGYSKTFASDGLLTENIIKYMNSGMNVPNILNQRSGRTGNGSEETFLFNILSQ